MSNTHTHTSEQPYFFNGAMQSLILTCSYNSVLGAIQNNKRGSYMHVHIHTVALGA